MRNFGILVRTILVVALLSSLIACNNPSSSQPLSDFDKLCKIHEENSQKPVSVLMQSVEIAERIQKEIPDVYVHYENISNADPKDAYRLFKKVAEEQTNKTWDCKVMKDFYSAHLQGQ